MPTRTAIAGKLARERAALLDHYQGLSAGQLADPCTDSEHEGGRPWAAKDHLAHIAGIERTFQDIVERTLAGERSPVAIGPKGASGVELMAAVHRMNEAHVDAHRSTPYWPTSPPPAPTPSPLSPASPTTTWPVPCPVRPGPTAPSAASSSPSATTTSSTWSGSPKGWRRAPELLAAMAAVRRTER